MQIPVRLAHGAARSISVLAALGLLFVGGCDKARSGAAPVPVAVDKGAAAEEKAGKSREKAGDPGKSAQPGAVELVPSEAALAKAGALHPDKPGGGGRATALPPGHPQVLPKGHPPIAGQPAGNIAGGAAQPAPKKGFVATKITEKIDPATGDNAYTVADIHGKKATLGGKPVAVRGKVVKFNSAIMNRNWLHIQDGTGTAEAGDHDLTVTTGAEVAVGDIVTVTGALAIDKDFGAGYRYAVIVEQATVAK